MASAGTRDVLLLKEPPSIQRLFAFDPSRPERLPVALTDENDFESDALAFFELSPDRTRVVYRTVKRGDARASPVRRPYRPPSSRS